MCQKSAAALIGMALVMVPFFVLGKEEKEKLENVDEDESKAPHKGKERTENTQGTASFHYPARSKRFAESEQGLFCSLRFICYGGIFRRKIQILLESSKSQENLLE